VLKSAAKKASNYSNSARCQRGSHGTRLAMTIDVNIRHPDLSRSSTGSERPEFIEGPRQPLTRALPSKALRTSSFRLHSYLPS
jgi:hypothetical protein